MVLYLCFLQIPGARPDGSADETPDSSTFQRFIENHREVPVCETCRNPDYLFTYK